MSDDASLHGFFVNARSDDSSNGGLEHTTGGDLGKYRISCDFLVERFLEPVGGVIITHERPMEVLTGNWLG